MLVEAVGVFLERLTHREQSLAERAVGATAVNVLRRMAKDLSHPEKGMSAEIWPHSHSDRMIILTWRSLHNSNPSVFPGKFIPGFSRAVAVEEVSSTEIAVKWAEMYRSGDSEEARWIGVALFIPDDSHRYTSLAGEDFSRIPKNHRLTIEDALKIAVNRALYCPDTEIHKLSRV